MSSSRSRKLSENRRYQIPPDASYDHSGFELTVPEDLWPAEFHDVTLPDFGTLPAKLIEDKANGSAVVQFLQNEIPGIIPVNPEGGKIGRAAAVSPLIEAGNVYLPHPQFMPWVNEFIEECAAFPNGAHDDQVDAMTQALLRWNIVREEYAVIQICEPVRISPY